MKLNIGCGPHWREMPQDGWVHADVENYGQQIVWDIAQPERVEYPDDGYDCAVMNHVLHMVRYDLVPGALVNVRDVLRSGGVLRVIERDPIEAYAAYIRGDDAWFPISDDIEPNIAGKLCAWLTWYSTVRTLFTRTTLQHRLLDAGFSESIPVEYGETVLCDDRSITELDSRERESFIIEARA